MVSCWARLIDYFRQSYAVVEQVIQSDYRHDQCKCNGSLPRYCCERRPLNNWDTSDSPIQEVHDLASYNFFYVLPTLWRSRPQLRRVDLGEEASEETLGSCAWMLRSLRSRLVQYRSTFIRWSRMLWLMIYLVHWQSVMSQGEFNDTEMIKAFLNP